MYEVVIVWKGAILMDLNSKVFKDSAVKQAIGECEVLNHNITMRGRSGMQTLELDVMDTQHNRHIVILQDMGGKIIKTDVAVGIVKNREERNCEIKRLYDEYHLSQIFLARFFRPGAVFNINDCAHGRNGIKFYMKT